MDTTTVNPRKHRYFSRWHFMNLRCTDPKNKDYFYYGQRGIKVCPDWSASNPDGFTNFLEWLQPELEVQIYGDAFVVGRRDTTKEFSPSNCILQTRVIANQLKGNARLTVDFVVAARRAVRADPKLEIKDLIKRFGFGTMSSWSAALLGRNWKSADAIEAPINARTPFVNLQPATGSTKLTVSEDEMVHV